MKAISEENFKHSYETHLKHLKLKGLQPKTIEAYARAVRRIGMYFDHRIDALCTNRTIYDPFFSAQKLTGKKQNKRQRET